MTHKLLLVALLAGSALVGCAAPLSSNQKAELNVYRAKGLEVTEKDPATGSALGVLPGGGSFYTRNYLFGVANLLAWPFSVMWDPISGRNGAEAINYEATKRAIASKRNAEIYDLDAGLTANRITPEQYLQEKTAVERKYAPSI